MFIGQLLANYSLTLLNFRPTLTLMGSPTTAVTGRGLGRGPTPQRKPAPEMTGKPNDVMRSTNLGRARYRRSRTKFRTMRKN